MIVTQSWIEVEFQDEWTLSSDEMALLLGMTDKGRLGFAAQLKFMQIHGRFPERHEEIDPNATQWLGAQIGAPDAMLSAYELDGRQGRRHRQTIRSFLGFRPATGNDLKVLGQWLNEEEVLPFDPQARHGLDRAVDWCRALGSARLRSRTPRQDLLSPERCQPNRDRPATGH
jgi:hypothetical protein